MRCEVHTNQLIQYVCQSPSCDFMSLCKQCKRKHPAQHNNYLIRYQLALEKASKKIDLQIKKLQEYIQPIQKKRKTLSAVNQQIQQLQRDKKQLIRKITDQINQQIQQLKLKNGFKSQDKEQQKFYEQLQTKMRSLKQLKQKAGSQSKVLRSCLTLQIQPYLYYFGKNNPYFTTRNRASKNTNTATLYVKTKHQMIVSKLQTQQQILNPKLLKKVNNESPLYFLIDPKYQTSRFLHYFYQQSAQKCLQLRVYDVEKGKWNKFINRDQNFQFTTQFTSVYDDELKRYYYIGGLDARESSPSNQLMWYDLGKNSWQRKFLQLPRYSAMSTLVVGSRDDRRVNYVLIAGGIDEDGKVLKSWQLFDPQKEQIVCSGQMNFPSAAGRLVTFNGDTVFKIGGLANKSQKQYGVCPIVQKCDFSALNQSSQTNIKQFKFSYIQLQDINRQDKPNIGRSQYQLYYYGQGAIQINPNQILVYGGSRKEGYEDTKFDETYILNVQRFQMQNYKKQKTHANRYYARWINQKPLITPMSFQAFAPSIWKGRLYSLQNLPSGGQGKFKGLIQFDMKCWYETQNIVDDRI